MLRRKSRGTALLACTVGTILSLAGLWVRADDKKEEKDKPALSGVWARKEAELKIDFSDKDVMKISPHGKDELILIRCKVTLEKEGLVKAKITELEGKEKANEKLKEVAPVGLEFSFKWQVKNDSATLGEVKGDNVDALKGHLEGEYDLKK
jgi:hypothetical protein